MEKINFKFEQYIDDIKTMPLSDFRKFWRKTFGQTKSGFSWTQIVAMRAALATLQGEYEEGTEEAEETPESIVVDTAYTTAAIIRASAKDEASFNEEIANLDAVTMLILYLISKPEFIRRLSNFNIEEILLKIKKMSRSAFCKFWCKNFNKTQDDFEINAMAAEEMGAMLRASLEQAKNANDPEFDSMVIVSAQIIVYNIHNTHLEKSQMLPNKIDNIPYEEILTSIVYFAIQPQKG